jgi:hypothetical protein
MPNPMRGIGLWARPAAPRAPTESAPGPPGPPDAPPDRRATGAQAFDDSLVSVRRPGRQCASEKPAFTTESHSAT